MSASREKRLRRELREAELNDDSVKKSKKKKNKKAMTAARAKKIRSAIGTTVVILLVIVFALLIFVNSGFLQSRLTAVTTGSHKLTPAEFNYFYKDGFMNIYNQYNSSGLWSYMGVDTSKPIEDQDCMMAEGGGTWKDYLTDTVLENAQQVYTLYDAAQAEGFTLNEEDQTSLDSTISSIASSAESAGYKDADDYLEETYGKGANMESYTQYLTAQQVAYSYQTAKTEGFTYTDDELRSYYDENSQDYDKVTYRHFDVATDENDSNAAKETADAMQADLDGTEESFIKAAQDHAPEGSEETYEDEDYTLSKNQTYSAVSTDYADWLFSQERVAGESQVMATSSGYSVIMFISRDNNDYKTVNVRHILVQVDTTGTDEESGEAISTDEDWDACKEAIDAIEEEWSESDMTEETFGTMAEEKSEDTGSAANGGLIEDIYKGQMVEEFEDWIFDEDRQVGDTGIVKTQYGYHLIYFSGTGEEYWKTLADSSKRSEDYETWFEEQSAAYEGKRNAFGQLFTDKALPRISG